MGGFRAGFPVNERAFAQAILRCASVAGRAFLLSSAVSASLRDGLAGIGISKMSVASKTTVGGYSDNAEASTEQFSISDERDVSEFCAMLKDKKLEPVFKHADAIYREPVTYAMSRPDAKTGADRHPHTPCTTATAGQFNTYNFFFRTENRAWAQCARGHLQRAADFKHESVPRFSSSSKMLLSTRLAPATYRAHDANKEQYECGNPCDPRCR